MTDDLATPEYLEALASAVRSLDARLSTFERQSLEDLLTHGGGARMGGAGLPSPQVGTNQAASSLGNVLPFVGQTNLLDDPTFERLADLDTTPAGVSFDAWSARHVVNSGSAPGRGQFYVLLARGNDQNPLNGAAAGLAVATAGSPFPFPGTPVDLTYYLHPAAPFVPSSTSLTLPYLVAAVRVGEWTASNLTNLTNLASVTVTLEIVNAAGVVRAASEPLDFKALVGRRPDQQQLVAAYRWDSIENWTWRLRVDVVTTGAGGQVRMGIGEPQLHFAYSPDPVPFAPQIGRWVPAKLASLSGQFGTSPTIVSSRFLLAQGHGGANEDLFEIDGRGLHRWGDGIGGGFDAFLTRSPQGGVQVGDDVLGGIIDRYDGADTFNTYTPTVANVGGATWTTREGWWQRIGKMVFVAVSLVVNGAGSGTGVVTVSLPFDASSALSQVLPGTRGGTGILGPLAAGVGTTTISQIRLRDGSELQGADLASGASFRIQGWYRAA